MEANRKSIRAPVVPTQIRGLITRAADGEQCPFLIWDVSETGMGLWCPTELNNGEEIKLTVGQPFPLMLNCRVMWIRKDENDESEGFRCGVEVIDEPKKLESLYNKFRELMEEKASTATGS